MRSPLRLFSRTQRERSEHRWPDDAGRPAPWSPLRRRVDNMALRWHARLDSPFADRSLPPILAGLIFVGLAAMALARVRSLEPSESLARFTQATWQLHQADPSAITLLPVGVEAPQPLSHLDGSLVLYPLGWLVGFLPIREALVTLQSAALAFAVLPLWRLSRRVANLRVGATTAVIVAYALFPPVHLMNTDGFNPLVLALPLLLGVIHRALSGSIIRLGLGALLVLVCSTQLALVLVGLGAMLSLTVRRRSGIGLGLLGVIGMVGEHSVAWLGAGDRAFVDGVSFPAGTRSAAGILIDAIVHPLASLGHLGQQRVLVTVVALLLPVAFLPLFSLRHLAPVIPLQLVYLLGSLPHDQLLGAQAAATTAFVFAAAALALGRLGRSGSDRVSVPPRLSGTLVGVAALFFVLDAASSPYQHPWNWGGRDAVDAVRLQWTEEVLAGAENPMTVAATSDMSPILAGGGVVTCALPASRHPCPVPPVLYLVDLRLDPFTASRPDLVVVQSQADGRLAMLRPRSAVGAAPAQAQPGTGTAQRTVR